MRQGPHQKRGRGRGNRRSSTPNRNQTFDSNGPDVRIRGNASQVYEKYLNLARDATASGDRVLAESYYQHAEHYYRILAAFQESQGGENRNQPYQGSGREWEQDDDGESGDERSDGGEQANRGEQAGRGDQGGRGDRQRADGERGGDWNRGDRGDRGERGDRGDRGDRFGRDRDRGERRPMRAEGDGEGRGERAPAPQPEAESAPVAESPSEVVETAPAEAPAAPRAESAPPADGNDADGIRRTLRLTSSRSARDAAPAAEATEAAPEAEPTEAAAEPERKPRRRRASPKTEAANKSEGFVSPPAVDDDGAVAAS